MNNHEVYDKQWIDDNHIVVERYIAKNELGEYLTNIWKGNQKQIANIEKVHNSKNNGIKVDSTFYKQANNIALNDRQQILNDIYIHGIEKGYVYHPQQLSNMIGRDQDFYNIGGNIYVRSGNLFIKLKTFVDQNIYNKTYDDLIGDINILYTNISANSKINLFMCVCIGDLTVGENLLKKIIEYKNKINSNFYIGITFRNIKIYMALENIIKKNLSNYIIFNHKEYGNDIIPSLQVFNYFVNLYDFKYVMKLHTKSNADHFNQCVDYLLSNNLNNLAIMLEKNKKISNCLGNPKYYLKISTDHFNRILVDRHKKYIDNSKFFVATTNFFCKKNNILNILQFIKNNNPQQFFNNNMYDTNGVNRSNSPVHFLERLFGTINNVV
jgi:hypothetical protein